MLIENQLLNGQLYNLQKILMIVGGRTTNPVNTTNHQKHHPKPPEARHCHPERNAAPGAETRNGSRGESVVKVSNGEWRDSKKQFDWAASSVTEHL